jgi:hypothetical protein
MDEPQAVERVRVASSKLGTMFLISTASHFFVPNFDGQAKNTRKQLGNKKTDYYGFPKAKNVYTTGTKNVCLEKWNILLSVCRMIHFNLRDN